MLARAFVLALSLCSTVIGARAVPITPASDAEVIETLPLALAQRSEIKRLKRALAVRPQQPALAARLASRLLAQARAEGEPRLAGQALAVLAPWSDEARSPGSAEVQIVLADTEQHLHEFARATQRVQHLLERDADQPQAWLMLATLERLRGEYAASDRACAMLQQLGASLHALACHAENLGLRGEVASARRTLQELIDRGGDAPTRAWLLCTLAELEQRAARPAQAEVAFRAALSLQADAYATIALADLLIAQGRADEAFSMLQALPRSDSVLLRMDIAARDARRADAAQLTTQLRERMADAAQRGGVSPHAREQALFAMRVEGDVPRALELARQNVRLQREPGDVLLLAQAARASGQGESTNEGRALAREMGLHDERLAMP